MDGWRVKLETDDGRSRKQPPATVAAPRRFRRGGEDQNMNEKGGWMVSLILIPCGPWPALPSLLSTLVWVGRVYGRQLAPSGRRLATMDGSQGEKIGRVFNTAATVDPSIESVSSVWSTIIPDKTTDMSATERSAGLVTSLTDAAYGQNPYYNGSYAGYSMYGGNPASYYQQVASNLRAGNAAAFPYGIGTAAAAQGYYNGSYPTTFNISDYSSAYSQQYYNGMRSGYYGGLGTAYAGGTIGETGADLSFAPKDKKGKTSKKKKSGSCSPDGQQFARVFVWELEEICPLATAQKGHLHFIRPLQQLVQQTVGQCFSLDQLDEFDICNVEDAAQEDALGEAALVDARGGVEVTRRVANKYFQLRQFYQEFACKTDTSNYALIERCGMASQRAEIEDGVRQLDTFFPGRVIASKRCLDIVFQRSSVSQKEKYANVVVSGDRLPTAAAMLLQAGLGASVPLENIYSASKGNRETVMEKITSRFGKKCSYIVISQEPDTMELARKENIPVWPTQSPDHLDKFYNAQSNYLLGPL